MVRLERDGELFVLDLGDDENRFTLENNRAIASALDEIASAEGPRALVTTASGKIWSNGLDLDWLLPRPDEAREYILSVQEIFVKFLTLPVPSVAAVGGHAFAAGMMMALCHDFRVMRVDRGYLCVPEVDLGIPFTYGMSALLAARLEPQVAHEAMVTGRRYGATDALSVRMIDHAVELARVLEVSCELARPLAVKAGPSMGTIKQRLYGDVITHLRTLGPEPSL